MARRRIQTFANRYDALNAAARAGFFLDARPFRDHLGWHVENIQTGEVL